MPETTPRQFRLTPERIAILDELAIRWSGKLRKATRTDVLNWLIDQAWEAEKRPKKNSQKSSVTP